MKDSLGNQNHRGKINRIATVWLSITQLFGMSLSKLLFFYHHCIMFLLNKSEQAQQHLIGGKSFHSQQLLL
jgi:hypothetical protein